MNRYLYIAFIVGLLSSFIGGSLGLMAASSYSGERTQLVFVYDHLTNPVVRSLACRCFVGGEAVRLDGYIQTVDSIMPTKSGFVRGELIIVNDDELAKLDRYFDTKKKADRARIRVNNRSTWVYLEKEK